MEIARSDSTRLPVEEAPSNFILPIRFHYLPIFFVLLLFSSELVVLIVGALPRDVANTSPFAAFEEIMPGQAASILRQYPCTFQLIIPSEHNSVLCQMTLDDRLSVTIIIQNGWIRSLSFKNTDWHLDDLIQRWGFPDEIKNVREFVQVGWPKRSLSISWYNHHIHAVLAPLPTSFMWSQNTPVWYLLIDGDD